MSDWIIDDFSSNSFKNNYSVIGAERYTILARLIS